MRLTDFDLSTRVTTSSRHFILKLTEKGSIQTNDNMSLRDSESALTWFSGLNGFVKTGFCGHILVLNL